MSARVLPVVTCVLFVWVSSELCWGQDTLTQAAFDSWKTGEFEPAKQEMDQLAKRVAQLTARLNNVDKKRLAPMATDLEALKAEVSTLRTDVVAPLVPEVQNNRTELDELKKEVEALKKVVENQDAKLEAVARKAGDTWIPNVASAWQTPEFRDDMRRVVQDSIPRLGTLRIVNDTDVEQVLRVNGMPLTVPRYDFMDRQVPVGPLSTQLVGQEPVKAWTIAPPNYYLEIRIKPSGSQDWRWDPFLGEWVRVLPPPAYGFLPR